MQPTILRQWVMLAMLPSPPRRIDTATLEQRLRDRGYDVHRRTIQRDLVQLSSVLPIVSDQRVKPFGWRWAENAYALFAGAANNGHTTMRVRLRGADVTRLLEALGVRGVDDGEYTVHDDAETRRVLFGFSDSVEVLAPANVRRDIADRARRAGRIHG